MDLISFIKVLQANEQGLANFIGERIDQYEKFRWMINASLATIVN